jgi:hypothetical protein
MMRMTIGGPGSSGPTPKNSKAIQIALFPIVAAVILATIMDNSDPGVISYGSIYVLMTGILFSGWFIYRISRKTSHQSGHLHAASYDPFLHNPMSMMSVDNPPLTPTTDPNPSWEPTSDSPSTFDSSPSFDSSACFDSGSSSCGSCTND